MGGGDDLPLLPGFLLYYYYVDVLLLLSRKHYPQTNLAQFQKGICCMGIKIFNHLPTNIKSRSNDLSFKLQLTTTFLLQNSFYTCDAFYTNKFA
jgi:hypothetical protein